MTVQMIPPAPSALPANDKAATSSQKLAKSARQFEAILLQSWLEKMNHSFAGLEESQDAAHDTLSSLGTQAIAGALAARGGIGIAGMILQHLQAHTAQEDGAGTPQSDTAAHSARLRGR